MALGSSLVADVKVAITNSEDFTEFASNLATAINSYLSGAIYAGGSGLYTSSIPPTTFLLPDTESVVSSATIIALGTQSYYLSGVVPAIVGSPTNGGVSVASCVITGSLISPTLQASLQAIFSDLGGTLDSKASEIASAIETAIATITTSHIELTAVGVPIGPFIGGIT